MFGVCFIIKCILDVMDQFDFSRKVCLIQIRQMVTMDTHLEKLPCDNLSVCLFCVYISFICLICEVVLLSGHLDSWDVGQGAMDDGGGAMISWEVLSLIKDLGSIKTNIPYRQTYTGH